jgi:hypothetical protein
MPVAVENEKVDLAQDQPDHGLGPSPPPATSSTVGVSVFFI